MASDAPIVRGTVLGDFEIIEALARGGMGTVYTATQRSTGERCAVKVMHAALVHDARNRERFTREAELCARIDSENVVRVLASGIDELRDAPWMAMELVAGDDLEKLSRQRGAWPLEEAREVLQQLYAGVAAAHRMGVVHRDLKPQNVLLTQGEGADVPHVKVLDFGISKSSDKSGTDTTAAVGSPLWMAPEQAQRGRLTPATDVFALALLTFRLLTGRSYWRSAAEKRPTLKETLVELLMKPYPPASARATELGGAALPAGFDGWFDRAAHRDPAKRYPDAGAAWDALARVLDGRPSAVATAPTTPVPPAPAVDEDAVATQPLGRPRPSSPAVVPVSALRSPTPAPLPQLLDEARAARAEESPPRPFALHAAAIAVAVVLVVAALALLSRYHP
ncbi:MAG: serine/threonine-protein kinase [Polyangiales bacterium]